MVCCSAPDSDVLHYSIRSSTNTVALPPLSGPRVDDDGAIAEQGDDSLLGAIDWVSITGLSCPGAAVQGHARALQQALVRQWSRHPERSLSSWNGVSQCLQVEAGEVRGWACLRNAPNQRIEVCRAAPPSAFLGRHTNFAENCRTLMACFSWTDSTTYCGSQVLLYVDGVKVGQTSGGEKTPHLLINRLCEGETSESDGSASRMLGFRHALPPLTPGRHEVQREQTI